MRCVLLGVFANLCLSVGVAQAALESYVFSGTVSSVLTKPYGFTVISQTPVTGGFSYDPLLAATGTTGTAASGFTTAYRETVPGGFYADFGALHVSADSYDVKVSNDLLQPNKTLLDQFAIVWNSNSKPAPGSPLMTGGTTQTIGLLTVTLAYPSNHFSGTALPSVVGAHDFTSTLDLFSHTASGIDVIFNVASVTQIPAVPEPAADSLMLTGALITIAGWMWRQRRNRAGV